MKFKSRIRQTVTAIWVAADTSDVAFFSGLAIAAAGGVFVSIPMTLIAVGAVLVCKAAGGLRGIIWPPHPFDVRSDKRGQ